VWFFFNSKNNPFYHLMIKMSSEKFRQFVNLYLIPSISTFGIISNSENFLPYLMHLNILFLLFFLVLILIIFLDINRFNARWNILLKKHVSMKIF